MSLLRPKPIEGDILHMGHIYDISPIPAQLIWYYSRKPVIPQKARPEQKTQPLSLGDERHQQLLQWGPGMKESWDLGKLVKNHRFLRKKQFFEVTIPENTRNRSESIRNEFPVKFYRILYPKKYLTPSERRDRANL